MRTDEDGTVHPTASDPFDWAGLVHISTCPQCQAVHGPIVTGYAQEAASMPEDQWRRFYG